MNTPKLSPEQWNKRIVVWSIVIVSFCFSYIFIVRNPILNYFIQYMLKSKSLCIFLGCIIGMTPLLFIDHKDKEKKNENEKTK